MDSWQEASTSFDILAAQIDDTLNSIYALTNSGNLVKSTDGSVSWATVNTQLLPCPQNFLRCANGDIVLYSYGCATRGIYVSTDNGATFGAAPKYVLSSTEFLYNFFSTSTNAIFLKVNNNNSGYKLLRSVDRGNSWQELATPIQFLGAFTDGHGKLYINYGGTIYESNDNGDTWISLPSIPGAVGETSGRSFSDPEVLFISGYKTINDQPIYGLWRKVNTEANWNFISTGSSYIISLLLSNNRISVGTYGALHYSEDGGITFNEKSKGFTGISISDIELFSPSKITALSISQLSFQTLDLQNWTNTSERLKAEKFFKKPNGSILATSSSKIYETLDNSESWKQVGSLSNLGQLVTADGALYFATTTETKIKYTNDLSQWNELPISGLPNSFSFRSIAVNTSGNVFIVIYNNSLGKTEAYQIIFGSAIKIDQAESPQNLIYRYEDEKILLYDAAGSILETSDGSTWIKRSSPSGNKLIVAENGYYFIPNYGGFLWLSRNHSQNWQSVGVNANGLGFTDIIVNEFNGYAYASLENSAVLKSGNIVLPVETVAPAIQTLSPANTAADVGVKPMLQITFNEISKPVAGKKIKIFELTNPISAIEILDVSSGVRDGKTITFSPTTRLAYNKSYFVIIDNGAVTDIFENAFQGINTNSQWRFTTKSSPTISSIAPVNAATNLSLTPTLTVAFSEALNFVNGKKMYVYEPGELTPVPCTITPIVSGNSLTFNPCIPLQYGKQYIVRFEADAFVSLEGAPLSFFTNNTDWTFSTLAAPDITAPTISYSQTNFLEGSANKLQIAVTDNASGSGVNTSSVRIFYRGILSSGAPTEGTLTGTANNLYEFSVPDALMDELGLEFRFEAKDNSGNIAVHPTLNTYHKSYISFPDTSYPKLPSTLLSFGGKVSNYRIISIPYTLQDNKISTIFSELGEADNSQFRILTYSGDNKYSEYPSLNSIARGTGYWINIRHQAQIEIENPTTPENSKENLFSLTLNPGWNQIGNPFPFPISWNAIKTVSGNADISTLKKFNGTSFENADKLNVFEGGFVFLNGTTSINVSIPFSAKTTAGREKGIDQNFTEGWMLPLTLRSNSFENVLGGIGMHPEAKESFDQFDEVSPPDFFGFPKINFLHNEHFAKDFTRDVVPSKDKYVWDFTVDALDQESILAWGDIAGEKPPGDIFIFDNSVQRLIDMKVEKSYKILPGKLSSFTIYVGVDLDKIKPSLITLGKPFPNPADKNAQISFTLPERGNNSYNITLCVFDILGNKIATLIRGEFQSGFYSSEWNMESFDAGLYLYRLEVFNSLTHEILTEKLVLQK